MNHDTNEKVMIFKALADTNRLMIIDMLSCGELCACNILEKLGITQPTLSHHMKILCDCEIVNARKDGKWTYYALNTDTMANFIHYLSALTTKKSDCICHQGRVTNEQ